MSEVPEVEASPNGEEDQPEAIAPAAAPAAVDDASGAADADAEDDASSAADADAEDDASSTADADAEDDASGAADADAEDVVFSTADADAVIASPKPAAAPKAASPKAAASPAVEQEADEEPQEEEQAAPARHLVEGSQWYILQTYSGFENRVKKTIEEKLRVANLGHLVEEVFVPGEDVTRVKNGRKRTMHVIYFPGYVLIKMNLTDELWHLLMDIPRVAGFVGGNNREPQALGEEELSHIRSQMSEGFRQATLKDEFEVGQQVIVIDGPFANFSGKIDEVNVEKNKLRVLISILGRSTPVELDFDKVKAHPDAG